MVESARSMMGHTNHYPQQDASMWLGYCCGCVLLFSTSCSEAPHAVADTRKLRAGSVSTENLVVRFVGIDPKNENHDADVSIILLLPDARWRELKFKDLKVKFSTAEEVEKWNHHL